MCSEDHTLLAASCGILLLSVLTILLTVCTSRKWTHLFVATVTIATFTQVMFTGIMGSQLFVYGHPHHTKGMQEDLKMQLEASFDMVDMGTGADRASAWDNTQNVPCVGVNGYDDYVSNNRLIPSRFLCDCAHKVVRAYDPLSQSEISSSETDCKVRGTSQTCTPLYVNNIYVADYEGCWGNILTEFTATYYRLEIVKYISTMLITLLQSVLMMAALLATVGQRRSIST